MSFIKKADLIPLLQQHGYSVVQEDDIPEDMFQLFVNNMEAQLREGIRVAIVSADNDKRKQLKEKDIQSILNQLRIFPQKPK